MARRKGNPENKCSSRYPGIRRVWRCPKCENIFEREIDALNHDKEGHSFAPY